MAKKKKNASQTNVAEVRKQNAASASGMSTEFASETDAQEVRQQNQQAESRKKKNS